MKSFVSSTFADLKAHRFAAAEALERLGQQVSHMEAFGARPEEPAAVCFGEIEKCDLFIGVYARRYGFIPSGAESSITEQEYDHAIKHHKRLFCFIVDDNHPWPQEFIEGEPGQSKLASFKQRIGQSLLRETFTTPEDLRFKVAASVGRYLAERNGEPGQNSPHASELHSAGVRHSQFDPADYVHDKRAGIYRHKETHEAVCKSCFIQGRVSPLTELPQGWRCDVKGCEQFYSNPDFVPKPTKPFDWNPLYQ